VVGAPQAAELPVVELMETPTKLWSYYGLVSFPLPFLPWERIECIYAGEFEDAEENKLVYTDLFRQYTELVGELLGSSCKGFRLLLAKLRR